MNRLIRSVDEVIMLRKSQYWNIGFWQSKSKLVDLFWIDLLCVLGKILDVSDKTSHPIN
jgi:hypothetical protein